MKTISRFLAIALSLTLLFGCTSPEDTKNTTDEPSKEDVTTNPSEPKEDTPSDTPTDATEPAKDNSNTTDTSTTPPATSTPAPATEDRFAGYTIIEVDGGNKSGHRQAKVAVDIGFGDRSYWAFTNEHGQLVRVIADTIILQDDNKEPVTSSGRYYHDEAKVPGVERDDLDEGHVIADSLGGVSNAYNITPQDSTLNRHGDQAYMEKVIRDAGGATNFEAIITYPNTTTQIPSHYQYTYTVRGNKVVDSYPNGNPDKANASQGLTTSTPPASSNNNGSTNQASGDVSKVDTNGNGKVTIQEAKDAGFSMPIKRGHWLYPYMDDRDGDGVVGE